MKKKLWKYILAVFFCIFGVAIIIVHCCWAIKQHKAVDIAKDYLQQKYEEEMEYVDIRLSLIDPCLYHVFFSSQTKTDIVFEVLVQLDLTILELTDGKSADNYYIVLFEYMAEQYLESAAKSLWEAESEITVTVNQQGLYAYTIDETVNENLPLSEMEKLFDYDITIQITGGESHLLDVEKLFRFIMLLKDNGFQPALVTYSDAIHTQTAEWTVLNKVVSADQLHKVWQRD